MNCNCAFTKRKPTPDNLGMWVRATMCEFCLNDPNRETDHNAGAMIYRAECIRNEIARRERLLAEALASGMTTEKIEWARIVKGKAQEDTNLCRECLEHTDAWSPCCSGSDDDEINEAFEILTAIGEEE